MSNFKYSFEKGILTILKCPNTIAPKHIDLISKTIDLKRIKKIILPDNVEEIIEKTFSQMNFNEIILSKSLKVIGRKAFERCENLKYIEIPEGVRLISTSTFGESGIEHIKLPKSLKVIGYRAFSKSNLKSIDIPEGVEDILEEAFCRCYKLNKVNIPSTLKSIETYSFGLTTSLKEIELPKNLINFGESVFEGSGITKIVMNNKLEFLPSETFANAYRLKKVTLPSNLKVIGDSAFEGCRSLYSLELPESVEKLEKEAFKHSKIRNIRLPNSLREIDSACFSLCDNLGKIVIPSGVKKIKPYTFSSSLIEGINLPSSIEIIEEYAFEKCLLLNKIEIPEGTKKIERKVFGFSSLKEIKLPTTIQQVSYDAFYGTKLRTLVVNDAGEEKNISVRPEYFMENKKDKILLSRGRHLAEVEFYDNGKYVKYKEYPVLKKYKHGAFVESDPFVKINLWYWYNKNKFLPHYTIIENMPVEDIDMFYINNNCEVWKEIVEKSKIKQDHNKATLFKLCYVLGVFQESGSKRDAAYKFIKTYITSKFNENKIHVMFDGLDLSNGYDEMFASFFMKYFCKDPYFLYDKENAVYLYDTAYNNFKDVKRRYPNRKVNTNRESDLLLPMHVENVILNHEYDKVEEGNELLAELISKYGYNQYQFEELQSLYDKAKEINQEKLKIFIGEDVEDKNNVTYELLKKDNPLGAVLGDITNCCQIIGGAGESCVSYGMIMPNSKFMTFNYNNEILGQSWVWYDEYNKTICLDNIEVPEKYVNKIKKSRLLQESFIACLKRVGFNFIKEMKSKGLEVEKVTIGKGYNDINYILKNYFKNDENSKRLSNYSGYSDANSQYEIVNISKR